MNRRTFLALGATAPVKSEEPNRAFFQVVSPATLVHYSKRAALAWSDITFPGVHEITKPVTPQELASAKELKRQYDEMVCGLERSVRELHQWAKEMPS